MCFKRKICACVFLTFWKSSIHLPILPIFLTCLNEITARPQLCNFPLIKDKSSVRPPLTAKNTLFFCILCGRGDLSSSLITTAWRQLYLKTWRHLLIIMREPGLVQHVLH